MPGTEKRGRATSDPAGSARSTLTPHMLKYAEKFDDRGDIRWLPYLMYFHPAGHVSDVVCTDSLGFRVSHGSDTRASVGGPRPKGPVRLLVGSSTVFGIGATNDRATLSSRLWTKHAPALPWLNFGGRSYNSTQEILLFTLYRHLLPEIDEIVIFSGFNDLGLARLPADQSGDHGAFFNCGDFFSRMANSGGEGRRQGLGLRRRRDTAPAADRVTPDLDEQIATASGLTLRHLDTWRLFAEAAGARLTYVLQPLATWVRERPAPQEAALFRELDSISDFGAVYGDIAAMGSGRLYAEALRRGCAGLGVRFLDISPTLAESAAADDWLFVDRIHFTDEGHDLVAGILTDQLDLS
ncbi:SGNH/GDSL hydrolase family protein [Streptomyces sp. NPDC050704]|uniref:SGNH/GDSL hydrolase family protein n=1 Tax=Streptomyces sp. NPDC050704 TaxID=3157219 RepID=UPI00344027EE